MLQDVPGVISCFPRIKMLSCYRELADVPSEARSQLKI
jgi:hypothetical protein